jgi:hypothetical protein
MGVGSERVLFQQRSFKGYVQRKAKSSERFFLWFI